MPETVDATLDEEVDDAVEAEKILSEDEDKVEMRDIGRKNKFYPCRVAEFKTITPSEFKDFSHRDFDEEHVVFRSGFGFMEDEELSQLSKYGLSIPEPHEEVITVKYELVEADEEWEMREFWKADEFPKNSFLRTIPNSRIGNIIGERPQGIVNRNNDPEASSLTARRFLFQRRT